jgi:hypothetical protein
MPVGFHPIACGDFSSKALVMKIKPRLTKLAATPQTPPYPKMPHRLRSSVKATVADSKPAKRENTFSKSRDTHEDRGTREMKTAHNAQTFPHAR